jgi:polynucleotide 5'-hydroxyl-kinase GRC3/NOL9
VLDQLFPVPGVDRLGTEKPDIQIKPYIYKVTDSHSNWVQLVKGPSEVYVEGHADVLGKDVSNSQVYVDVGKILPFETSAGCNIQLRGGETWLASRHSAGTTIWQQIIQNIFADRVSRMILIFGKTDAGKSSLATYIVNKALKLGLKPRLIDADIGQGDLAPPNAIGGAVVETQITDIRDVKAQFFEFIGSTSPVGFEDIIIKSIKKILLKIGNLGGICIINTDGYFLDKGITYKLRLAEELTPGLVVCLGQGHVYDEFKAKSSSSVVLHAKSPASNLFKSRIDRNQRRQAQLLRYVSDDYNNNNKLLSKGLKSINFVYGGIIFSARQIMCGSGCLYLIKRKKRIERWRLIDMFVGLGFNRNFVGFGVISNVSRRKIYIKSAVANFNEVYLSKSTVDNNRVHPIY